MRRRDAALELLKSPDLLDRILADFERCGVVGEATNKLTGYLAATSRKLEQPLAVVLQSSSAAGKSSLMEAVLAMLPPEEVTKFSAMTGQSLFYMQGSDLRHKVLAIVEEEGAERASYALKLLQSEGELTIASTGKDPQTGRLVTQEYRVEGPVMIFLTTTAAEIDEELLNRCLVLSVSEDREQTRAIHIMQRKRQTLAGLLEQRERAAVLAVHRDAQRLLYPVLVANPFADRLTFLDSRTRSRRDHVKYLTLIRTVALLHQHQREHKTVEHPPASGQFVEYIEVTPGDIAIANRLTHEVLGRSLDELAPQTRRLLVMLDQHVMGECQRRKMPRSDYRFTRRQVRTFAGWTDFVVRTHLQKLVDLEYVLVHRGGRGQSFVYELLYGGEGTDGKPFALGLIDPDSLGNSAYVEKFEHQNSRFEGGSSLHSAPIEPGSCARKRRISRQSRAGIHVQRGSGQNRASGDAFGRRASYRYINVPTFFFSRLDKLGTGRRFQRPGGGSCRVEAGIPGQGRSSAIPPTRAAWPRCATNTWTTWRCSTSRPTPSTCGGSTSTSSSSGARSARSCARRSHQADCGPLPALDVSVPFSQGQAAELHQSERTAGGGQGVVPLADALQPYPLQPGIRCGPSARGPQAAASRADGQRGRSNPQRHGDQGPARLRDRAFLETLYSTGLRRREMVNLSIYDVDMERGTVLVRKGKNRKDRIVPIGQRAILWLSKYLSEARPQLAPNREEALFVTQIGDPFTANSATQLARQYVEKAKLPSGKRGACHLFRHTMATLMLEGGADVRYVQAMLGHADISSTQIYTHVGIRTLQQVHAITHPAGLVKRPSSIGVAGNVLPAYGANEGSDLPDVLVEDPACRRGLREDQPLPRPGRAPPVNGNAADLADFLARDDDDDTLDELGAGDTGEAAGGAEVAAFGRADDG